LYSLTCPWRSSSSHSVGEEYRLWLHALASVFTGGSGVIVNLDAGVGMVNSRTSNY
jgi:hypothetical protein